MSGVSDLKAILHIRSFRRLWAVLGLSAIGDWLGLLASAIFAASLFDSAAAQGAAFSSVVVMRLLPAVVLGPLSGVVADRWDRRITMAVCDMLRFVLFLSLPIVALSVHSAVVATMWIVVIQFVTEGVSMIWMPAKEAAVPNLLPKARLETANQLTLITTYGLAPVAASGLMSLLDSPFIAPWLESFGTWSTPAAIALYLNAFTFLASAAVVLFMIPEMSVRKAAPGTDIASSEYRGILRELADGWRYVTDTKMVRGLVLGIMGAFAGAGVIIGTGTFYAKTLGGGNATFSILFSTIFVGLGVGLTIGPIVVKELSRRRWFGMSITLAGIGLFVNAAAPHLSVALVGTFIVGAGAGMAFLSGITLLGREVDDVVRGRIFAFISTGARVVLMLSVAAASVIGGLGAGRMIDLGLFEFELSGSRLLLLIAAALAVFVGVESFRQMDDKPGVPVLADLWGSMRGMPLSPGTPAERGFFIVFEGGEGSGKSTQSVKLAAWLRLRGHEVVLTREPGATDLGTRIRTLVLDPSSGMWPSARAEALLYAADRAQHVDKVVRPALDAGSVVISDRYVDSSLAYQAAGRAMPADEIAWLSSWATDGLRPDLVVLLDIDPADGLRRATKNGADRLERESRSFHEKVRYKFQDIAAADPSRYLVVDGTLSPEQIAEKVTEKVAAMLPEPERPRNPSGWPQYDGDDAPAAAPADPDATEPIARPDRPETADERPLHDSDESTMERPAAKPPTDPDTSTMDRSVAPSPAAEPTPPAEGGTSRPERGIPGIDETAVFGRVTDDADATAVMPSIDDTENPKPVRYRPGRVSP